MDRTKPRYADLVENLRKAGISSPELIAQDLLKNWWKLLAEQVAENLNQMR